MIKSTVRFAFVLLIYLLIPLTATARAVDIPDPNLRAEVESALGVEAGGTITAADMATLTELQAPNANIRDLTGLAAAINLMSLDLGHEVVDRYLINSNAISDLSSLQGLTNLTTLILGSNSITDLTPLAGLTQLTTLDLGSNAISNIFPLAGLTNLTTLDLGINAISDLLPLAGLTNLTTLELHYNSISDLSPLAGLTNLETLALYNNSISDISPLVDNMGLGRADWVGVRNNPLNDASINAHIPDLQRRGVAVGFNVIVMRPEDIVAEIPEPNLRAAIEIALGKPSGATITAADMANLSRLRASSSNISDLTGLERATNLSSLSLGANSISDISPLVGLTNLSNLEVGYNAISDISPLVENTGWGQGDRLDLRGNPLNDAAINAHIPTLQDRGVTVEHDVMIVQPVELAQMEVIPDPNLRDAIADALGKASGATITEADMANLYDLEASGTNIGDLSGLERATNLTYLRLRGNPISDISPLAGLTKMTSLTLSGGAVSNISPLAGLTNLTFLRLGGNPISDISPLAGLTNLVNLDLSNAYISDISPLGELTNLTGLILSWNSVTDISPLAGLVRLRTLALRFNSISNISPLAGLINLIDQVNLGYNSISDISPLVANAGLGWGDTIELNENPLNNSSVNTHIPALLGRGVGVRFDGMILEPEEMTVDIPDPNLRAALEHELGKAPGDAITPDELELLDVLLLPNANISDLTGLEYAIYLRKLNLGPEVVEGDFINSNAVFDLSPLAGLSRLTTLGLGYNSISDLLPLAGLSRLTVLQLGNNSVSDLTPLAGLTQLTGLTLGNNPISDLLPLAGLSRLTTLLLENGSVSDLSPLDGLTQLITLDLGSNRITDLSPLSGLTRLTELRLHNNSISNLTPLAGLTRLTGLALRHNSVADLSALADLTLLTTLYLDNNSISNIMPIAELTRLTLLDLHKNSISDLSPLAELTFLSELALGSNKISNISPLAELTRLRRLGLENNSISNLSALTNSRQLTYLWLWGNNISDISPLVKIGALDDSATVNLHGNPLNNASINAHIPALKGRGVTIMFDEFVAQPADVNGDGSVNIVDLVFVASKLGNQGQNLAADVNGDGNVNILDLVFVASMLGAAAPSGHPQASETLTAVEVEQWLTDAQSLEVKDVITNRGIAMLRQLLASLVPAETVLLPNYPNPFNPETWIPYRLAEDADVTLTIYDTSGIMVRRLDLGHQLAGFYSNRGNAAYWDGRNENGESVFSGVYFYQLETPSFRQIRRMVILK